MSASPDDRTLHGEFLRAAADHPERPALVVDGETLSYSALRRRALAIAATLQGRRVASADDHPAEAPLTCVLGQRSAAGFAGILGALCSGRGYVPMLPSYPAARIALMIRRSRARELVVDGGGLRLLADVLAAVDAPLRVLMPDAAVDPALRERFADKHTLLGADDLADPAAWAPPVVSRDAAAYLLFTSGSTGEPKGVAVAHRNIVRFLDVVRERYDLRPEDRFSHMFEVTFDLSLFDLFGAWSSGACLCCPDGKQRLLPARYVGDAGLSVWFSVPSTALLMKDTRTLEAGAFPGLRLALFCGEALTVPVAAAFAEAAPAAIVENLYGPTELTLACTLYRYEAGDPALADADVVPIGAPFPGMRAKVVDEALREVAAGDSGELIVAGPQVALGYWDDPARTAASFVRPPGEDALFYRTGDRVRLDADGVLRFLGRLDHQVKIRGFRVELGEVEAVLRREAGVDAAVAVGWPVTSSGCAGGIVAFLDDAAVDVRALRRRLMEHLPRYMLPTQVKIVDAFPLNANGKIDRNALRATLS
ncbi:MAG: amino acid adenylation domain-containing protein [Nannocystaceae bacterium]